MKGQKQHAPRATDGAGKLPPTCGHPNKPQECRSMCAGCYKRWLFAVNPSAKVKAALRGGVTGKRRDRDTELKRKYGIDLDEYIAMTEHQEGLCYVCGEAPTERKPLATDHNHKTGKVRKLLCDRCNRTLGQVKDSAHLLRCLANYLDEHECVEFEP
jgi:hypothetical protein